MIAMSGPQMALHVAEANAINTSIATASSECTAIKVLEIMQFAITSTGSLGWDLDTVLIIELAFCKEWVPSILSGVAVHSVFPSTPRLCLHKRHKIA